MQEAFDAYIASVKALCPRMTADEAALLRQGLRAARYRNEHVFLEAGTLQRELGWVHTGLMRSFYVDGAGNEITVQFVREGCFAADHAALTACRPSKYQFQCIEPTTVVLFSYAHLVEAFDHFPALERYGRIQLEKAMVAQQQRIESFLFDSAEKRYADFVEEHPDLFNRVSLTHLSSYLGIARQSLSRIRKRIVAPDYVT
jgi:CRP/FNR family transcriptional regulator, anaerobic regulatory protein